MDYTQMSICDNLKKQILSRSIIFSLIDNALYPEFNIVNEELNKEIQNLSISEQIELINFIANVNNIAYDYISYSVGHSYRGELIEARNIRVNFIDDHQLYMMLVITFVNVIFNNETQSKQESLIELCRNSGFNFNKLIDTCLNFNFLDILNGNYNHENYSTNFDCNTNDNDNDNDSEYEYEYCDEYDGYDSVG